MCIFSGPIKDVAKTQIFARMRSPGRQVLAYQMHLAAEDAVAMILPLPVPAGTDEDAVRFISLEEYPEIFDDMFRAFTPPVGRGMGRATGVPLAQGLRVHTVGAFVASFVPSVADFSRLDPRFRLPPGTLDAIPAYADWGFAVFQLGATHTASQIHPMAFEFPTRAPHQLFFPTVHVHDGEVHEYAEFSHTLYAQSIDAADRRFETAQLPASDHVNHYRSMGLVDGRLPLSMARIVDIEKNQDHWVGCQAR